MAQHYNTLSGVDYNESITSRRFRVKIFRIHQYYSYVTGSGPHWVYVLADEHGDKMEMTINELTAETFEGLEKQEGKWVEIFWKIHEISHISSRNRNYPIDIMGVVFNTEAHFDDPEVPKMVFYIRDNIESEIKCVATYAHAYAFRDGFEIMRGCGQKWLENYCGLSDFRFNPRLEEVEEFRQSLNNSDPYVRKHGAMGPL
ncbi:hypothetical protein Bca4012_020505 [Brassica carinata]